MSKKKVIIVDYQLGNLFSVEQACRHVGIEAIISDRKEDIESADGLLLPGVGAFQEAMNNLENLGLIPSILSAVEEGKPLFGICLGQQLLFTESEEFGAKRGLNLIPGKIRKFPTHSGDGEKIKVPQIGWNKLKAAIELKNTPLHSLKDDAFMYFVHSYYVLPEQAENVLTTTNYEGVNYCSSVRGKNNIFATQFHPEKSGEPGLTIYRNWAEINALI